MANGDVKSVGATTIQRKVRADVVESWLRRDFWSADSSVDVEFAVCCDELVTGFCGCFEMIEMVINFDCGVLIDVVVEHVFVFLVVRWFSWK